MAGYTDRVFRRISYEYGACFAYTEMLSAESVLKRFDLVENYLPHEEPFTGIQIYGRDPEKIASAGEKLQSFGKWIDLNAGCPIKKVTKKGMGGALLKDLELLYDIVREMKKRISIPVSVKTRLGWDSENEAKIYWTLVESGADMVAIHARTVVQGFSGKPNWKALSKIIEHPVPLLVSGDIFKPEDALKALNESRADGILIARGAVGNPWIFSQVRSILRGEAYTEPGFEERLSVFERHIREEYDFKGERGIVEIRKFVSGYTHSLPHSREFRVRFMKVRDLKETLELIEDYRRFLRSYLSKSSKDESHSREDQYHDERI